MTAAAPQWGKSAATLGIESEAGHAPTKQTLAGILADKRMKLLSELRDIEQALEALEHSPEFEPTFQRVLKIINRSY